MKKDVESTTNTGNETNTMLAPVNNPESECYGCNGDCHICSGEMRDYNLCHNSYDFFEEPKKQIIKKQKEIPILKCYMCGWEHHNPNEWHNYRRATNGNLDKICGACSRLSLLDRTRLVDAD